MTSHLRGLHHVTAICSDPQRNVDFYTRVLGLRLIKQTVNFDDPGRWHLYYGDTTGQAGTVLTFFAWPDGNGGQVGIGQFGAVQLAIPSSALGFWIERLITLGISYQQPVRKFGERVVAFRDPDGLNLELVGVADVPPSDPWPEAAVPVEQAIRGVHGVSLWSSKPETAALFTDRLGFKGGGHQGTTERLTVGSGSRRAALDVVGARGLWPGEIGVGTIHHVAFAVGDRPDLETWQADLREHDLAVTDVRNRTYFESIYFEDPDGATIELATSGPGFTVDEDVQSLGSTLQLPPQLERQRLGLEGLLPPLLIEPRT